MISADAAADRVSKTAVIYVLPAAVQRGAVRVINSVCKGIIIHEVSPIKELGS